MTSLLNEGPLMSGLIREGTMKTSHLLKAGACVPFLVSIPVQAAPRSYNVPPQSLSGALQQFALQGGDQVVFEPQALAGKYSRGVSGTMEPEAALRRVIQGAKVTFRRAQGAYVIAMQSAPREQGAPAEKPVTIAEAPPAEDQVQDIIVTAQKRAETVQRTPVTVSAFSAAMLADTGINTAANLQGIVPGMTINRAQFDPNLVAVSIRGIQLQDTSKAIEPGIGYVVDGVSIGAPSGLLVDSFDVKRMEVLRGPQGTLFGRNTTGGALNIIRTVPDPSADPSVAARVTVGSFGRRDVGVRVMAPIVRDKLAFKATFISERDSGNIYNSTLGKHVGDKDRQDYNLTLHATPTDRLSATLIYERLDDKSQAPAVVSLLTPDLITLKVPGYFAGADAACQNPLTAFVCDARLDQNNDVTTSPTEQLNSLKLDALTLNLKYDFDTFSLVSITGFRNQKQHNFSYDDATVLGYFPFAWDEKYKTLNQEVRFESNFDGPFSIIAGAFYFRSKFFINAYNELDLAVLSPGTPPFTNILTSPFAYRTQYNSRSVALFAQAEYKATDRLKFILGGRQTWDRKTIDVALFAPGTGIVDPLPVSPFGPSPSTQGDIRQRAADAANFRKFTPKIGIQYQATPDFMAFASYSIGYNTGGFNSRPSDVSFIGPFRPEQLDAYEVGFKSDWLDRRLRVNVSAFYNIMKNKQEDLTVVNRDGIGGTTTVNAAKARYAGVEAEVVAIPVRGWTNSFAVGYLDAKYLNFSGDLSQGFRSDLTMLELRRVPKWTVGLVSDYEFDMGPGRFGINGKMSYVDKFETNILNDPRGRTPSTAKLDFSGRYSFSVGDVNYKIRLFVENVTDKHPLTGLFSANTPGSTLAFGVADPGRQWGLSLDVNF